MVDMNIFDEYLMDWICKNLNLGNTFLANKKEGKKNLEIPRSK